MRRTLKAIKRAYEDIPDHWGRAAFWIAVIIAVPTAMVAFASHLWWFWLWFRWFGVAMVVLVSVTFVLVCMAAYRTWKYRDPAQRTEQSPKVTAPPVNWAIWKARDTYTVSEFADILAKDDPSNNHLTTEARADSDHIAYPAWAKKLAQAWAFNRRTNCPARRPSASSVRSAHLRRNVLKAL